MNKYKIDLSGGYVTIVRAKTIQLARKWAKEEYGKVGNPIVARATKKDVEWVQTMSGMIHVAQM